MNSVFDALNEDLIDQEIARRTHLDFMQYTWQRPSSPMIVGFHTDMICKKLDEAFDRFRRGQSTYLMIKVPFRHGKSDMLSRYLPPHFLGEFPDCEVMVAGYGQDLVNKFSRAARNVLSDKKYKCLYPKSIPSKSAFNVKEWSLDNGNGVTLWTSFSGAMTGSGFHLGLIDDPFKNRQEVESETMRESRWESLTNDFLTRAAPVHIVIILATPWHPDDFFGRIKRESKKDENFPHFEELCFPAKAIDYKGEGKYPNDYLFTERFPVSWYLGQYATLGKYNASGLLDCNPEAREGLLIKCEEGVNYHYVDEKPEGFGVFGRGWDLASSEKQTLSPDPDFTVGIKGAIRVDYIEMLNEYGIKVEAPIYHIYIDDIKRAREEAPVRDMIIRTTAVADTREGAIQGIEAFAGYKDTYTTMAHVLTGICEVEKINMSGDKVTKAAMHIVTPFSAGNVYVNRNIDSEVLKKFFSTLLAFPTGAHDDDVDALTVMVALLKDCGYSTFGSMV